GPAPQPVAALPGGTVPVAGNGHAPGNGHGANGARNGGPAAGFDPRTFVPGRRPEIEYISPLRGGVIPEAGPLERKPAAAPASTLPRIAPAEPVSTYAEPPGQEESVDHDVEPALPDEARSRVAAAASAETAPVEAILPGSALHVRFASAPAQQVVEAFKVITQLVRERPGDTQVVVHVPAPGGRPHLMSLPRRVAYDAELLAEVKRRLGESFVQLTVAPPS
ncbi:MAG TPA: hypothetical protein VNL94_01325, partial [Candidatus Binatia bacterium]|nr:hypothetical protein [Candidatus Binatia bacterium]